MWIKICGCRAADDAAAVAAAGADAFGMLLAPGFRRSVDLATARGIRVAAPPGLLAFGLFVGQSAAEVAAIAAEVGLDGLQCHGDGADALYASFRGRYRLIRPWDMAGEEPSSGADWLLLEPGAGTGGGRGVPWDWGAVAARRPAAPFLLAGGLTPETVGSACRAVAPGGVDVSTGVETAGRKDPERIARFCAEARRWEHALERGGT